MSQLSPQKLKDLAPFLEKVYFYKHALSSKPWFSSTIPTYIHAFWSCKEQARASLSGAEERSAKELASENAKLKLAQTTETLQRTQEIYDKGKTTTSLNQIKTF